jgi:propanol-preferring alcohol dehydrogenase
VTQGGHLVYLGRGGGTLPVSPAILPFECTVRIPSWGTLPELAEVVALARSGAIRTRVQRFTLDQVPEAYRRLRRAEIAGRAVAIP